MFKIDRKIDVSSPRSDSHRSGDAMSESLTPAPVIQFVASTTGLCGLFPCRVRWPVRLPMVCAMVLGIDALEHRRELEGGGLTGANCELFHSVAVCCLFGSSIEPGQPPCICARTVSSQAARDHRTRLSPINLVFQSSENARKRSNPPDAPAHPECTAGCAVTGVLTVFTARRRCASGKCAPICMCPRGVYVFVLFFYIVCTTQALSCTGCVSRS